MAEPIQRSVVFVVDDSVTVRQLLALLLAQLDCECVTLDRGQACLDALATQRPRLILLDLHMSPMRGDEVCKRIKQSSEWADIPVVLMTADTAPHEIMHAWRAAAADFLPKPVKKPQLAAKLQAILKAPATATAPGKGRHRLLFVEDSEFYKRVLGGALEHAGFQLLYATDTRRALKLVETHAEAIDACLVDLVIPGADGLAAFRQLREHPKLQRKPVLALGDDPPDSPVAKEVLKLGGAPMLEKRQLPMDLVVSRLNTAMNRVAVDLRAAERVPFFSVVPFRSAPTEEWLYGFSYDVSSGGLFVKTLTPAPGGSTVELQLSFGGVSPAPISRAMVAWANPYRERKTFSCPVGMGLHFEALEPKEKELLARLVRQKAAPGPTP